MKDFVAPIAVTLSNCATLTTSASGPVTVGQNIKDTATLSGVTANAGGTITFNVYGPVDTTCATVLASSTANVNGPQ